MIALVTKLDGLNFLLFHVEQQKPYEYRWRIARPGTEWQPGTSATGAAVRVFPGESGCPVEVEWRGLSAATGQGRGRWRKAALHEFLAGIADFSFTFSRDHLFRKEDPITFIAPSRFIEGVASFTHRLTADWQARAGDAVTLRGAATDPLPANRLVIPGEFQTEQQGITITNTTPTTGSLIMVQGSPVLTSAPAPKTAYAAITRKPKAPPLP